MKLRLGEQDDLRTQSPPASDEEDDRNDDAFAHRRRRPGDEATTSSALLLNCPYPMPKRSATFDNASDRFLDAPPNHSNQATVAESFFGGTRGAGGDDDVEAQSSTLWPPRSTASNAELNQRRPRLAARLATGTIAALQRVKPTRKADAVALKMPSRRNIFSKRLIVFLSLQLINCVVCVGCYIWADD